MNELTPRQLEVLRLTLKGLTAQAIAYELGISIHTVQTHQERIYKAWGARNKTHMVALAHQKGLSG